MAIRKKFWLGRVRPRKRRQLDRPPDRARRGPEVGTRGPAARRSRIAGNHDILVSVTRIIKPSPTVGSRKSIRRGRAPQSGHWALQDAKARFSELVRRVRDEGPQHVTLHGRDEVVVIAAEEFRRLRGD